MDTTTNKNHLLRVGDLARRTNKTVRAIHLYEELGLLLPATRTSGGFRLYDPTAVDRVKWIDMLHGMGLDFGMDFDEQGNPIPGSGGRDLD